MAVQKSRKTPSTRGMRRSHDALKGPALSVDRTSGETHLRALERSGLDQTRQLRQPQLALERRFAAGELDRVD